MNDAIVYVASLSYGWGRGSHGLRKGAKEEVEGPETSSCLIHINVKANCKKIICKMFSQSRQKFPLLEIVKYIQHKVPSTSSSPSPSCG